MKIVTNENLEIGDMTKDMLERKPLPIGKTQFLEWSDRIIKASLVEADTESLRFILAERLQHISPTDAFMPDANFILQLRTIAVKETAFNIFCEIKSEREKRKKLAEETALKPLEGIDAGVLENKTVQSS